MFLKVFWAFHLHIYTLVPPAHVIFLGFILVVYLHFYRLNPLLTSLARAHKRVHVQNVRDFPQTKIDSEIISHYILSYTCTVTRDFFFFFQVFAKNSVIKNIFEKRKKSLTVEYE